MAEWATEDDIERRWRQRNADRDAMVRRLPQLIVGRVTNDAEQLSRKADWGPINPLRHPELLNALALLYRPFLSDVRDRTVLHLQPALTTLITSEMVDDAISGFGFTTEDLRPYWQRVTPPAQRGRG